QLVVYAAYRAGTLGIGCFELHELLQRVVDAAADIFGGLQDSVEEVLFLTNSLGLVPPRQSAGLLRWISQEIAFGQSLQQIARQLTDGYQVVPGTRVAQG